MSRIYLIDYLKTISILMVIFTHYEWAEKGNPFFTLVIAMAVPIFMIVSGYNMTMSYTRKTNGTLRELYAPKLLWQRLSRFLLPFIMIYPLEMILLVVVRGETFTWQELLYHFYRGGLGRVVTMSRYWSCCFSHFPLFSLPYPASLIGESGSWGLQI